MSKGVASPDVRTVAADTAQADSRTTSRVGRTTWR